MIGLDYQGGFFLSSCLGSYWCCSLKNHPHFLLQLLEEEERSWLLRLFLAELEQRPQLTIEQEQREE
jgi:hypothetical protein